MSINPDIKKAIEIIDQRIESLKNIRHNLAVEFGMNEILKPESVQSLAPESNAQMSFIPGGGIKTSKDKITEFLRHGKRPASRKEIVNGTGLPDGTVSYALNDRDKFQRTDNGWIIASSDNSSSQQSHSSASGDNGDNKTEAVRTFFRQCGDKGATPADLGDYLRSTGVTQNRSYAYSAVARLRKQEEIRRRGGRYYATDKLIPLSVNEVLQ